MTQPGLRSSWDPAYATGHVVVDAQHQRLFAMVDDLRTGVRESRSREVLMPALDELAAYTTEHFATEERMMADRGYPGLRDHATRHAELSSRARALILSYRTGERFLVSSLLQFLEDWLKHHIAGDDFSMVRWLREHPHG